MAPVPLLSEQLASRVRALRRIQLSELPAARREMATTAAGVVAVRAKVLERTVVILERAKHGALARATRAKADHLATVAQGIEGKLEYVLPLLISCFLRCCFLSCCRVGIY
jgi:diphthamide biosynthesis protein 3